MMMRKSKLKLEEWHTVGFELTACDLQDLGFSIEKQSDMSDAIKSGLCSQARLPFEPALNLTVEKIHDQDQSYYVWLRNFSTYQQLKSYFSEKTDEHGYPIIIHEVSHREKTPSSTASATIFDFSPFVRGSFSGSEEDSAENNKDFNLTNALSEPTLSRGKLIKSKSNYRKSLLGSVLLGGAGGYAIGKALAATVASTGSASLLIALCSIGGAVILLLLVAACYYKNQPHHPGFFDSSLSRKSEAISLGGTPLKPLAPVL